FAAGALAAAALSLAACGDDEGARPASMASTGAATTATVAPPAAPARTSASTPRTPAARPVTKPREPAGRAGRPGASKSGGFVPVRVPAGFLIFHGRITPPEIHVPAFL